MAMSGLCAIHGDHHGTGVGADAHLVVGVADLADHVADDVGISTTALVVISPATMAMPVVTIVSQATRLLGSWASRASRHAVGNLVGQLVGMAHADRFAGE